MLQQLTRSRLIQVWITAVSLVVVAGITFGARITLGTALILLALCLVPPAMILFLWREGPPQTIAEVLHDAEHAVKPPS